MNQIGQGPDPEAQILRGSSEEKPREATPSIPEHQLVRLIATGAYGEVWLGLNAVGTPRAVKVVRRAQHTSIESFEREFKGLQRFEPVSRSHEGLVDILTLGLLPGELGFYYVMELADSISGPLIMPMGAPAEAAGRIAPALGQCEKELQAYVPRTLRAELKSRGGFPADEVIELGLKLTAALAHLHGQGLVHRDVKPSNILFIRGEPKLADAGLVAAVDDARSLVGTAGYIAPEGPGTPQGDLYALGKVLYEAAFGKDRQEFPELPADMGSRSDHTRLLELNEIIATACAPDPRLRYPSAAAMLTDFELLQAGRSVKSRRSWKRVLGYGKKAALLAVAAGILYSLVPRSPHGSGARPSPIPEANAEYRKGINELHVNLDSKAAIRHFQRATELDGKFADAYAQLADAWFSTPGKAGKSDGRKAAQTAVALNPKSGLAQVFLAGAESFDLEFAAALERNKLAVKLSPDSEEVLLASALIFSTLGRTNEALANLNKAVRLGQDTPSRLRAIYTGLVYSWCRKYQLAISLWNETPSVRDRTPYRTLSLTYLAVGDYTNSMRVERQSALERGRDAKEVNAEFDALEKALGVGGPKTYWELRLKMEAPYEGEEQHFMTMATIHAQLGHREAFNFLRQALRETPYEFGALYTDPSFDGLRGMREYKDLEKVLWKRN